MDFDRIAVFYDFLKRIVFGKEIDKASNYFLKQMPPASKVLILGGGSGEILENFDSTHQVKYIEVSQVMLRKARLVKTAASVEFVKVNILEWDSAENFDLIITPFVLDFLAQDQLELFFSKYKQLMNPGGKWIHTDFYPKNAAHRYLVKTMYLFFNLSIKLDVKELPDFDLYFAEHGFNSQREALFFHSMIESKIYTKIE